MKTKTYLVALCTASLMVACSQKTSLVSVPVSHIAVEQLKDSIDYNMDVSGLPISDLQILRNAPAARQGFPIKDSYVRGVFNGTTWYDSLTWKFDAETNFNSVKEKEGESWRDYYYRASFETGAIKFTDEEQAFMKRVQEREDELKKQNFDVAEDLRVNMQNLINPTQLKEFDSLLCQQLAQDGFAIVPAEHEQVARIIVKKGKIPCLRAERLQQFPQFRNHRFVPATLSSLHRLHAARVGREQPVAIDDRFLV